MPTFAQRFLGDILQIQLDDSCNRQSEQGEGRRRRRKMKFALNSFVFDWITVLGALVLFLVLEHAISPFHRLFSLNDLSIQFPHAKHEQIPVWLLFSISYALPAVIILAVCRLLKRSKNTTHLSLLALSASTALTVFATALIKNGVGRPRPDLVDRCRPSEKALATMTGKLVDSSVCTTTDAHFLDEGFRSFPSGHASYAFAGLGFLAFWLAGQVMLFKAPPRAWKSFTCFTPLVAAAMIAVTRTEDYRHHWQDVTVGGSMGLIISYFVRSSPSLSQRQDADRQAYRQYFPSLKSEGCGEAYGEEEYEYASLEALESGRRD